MEKSSKKTKPSKTKKQKILFYILTGIALIFIIVFGISKYLENIDPLNQFNFDLISPQGVYNDLETAQPVDQQVDQ